LIDYISQLTAELTLMLYFIITIRIYISIRLITPLHISLSAAIEDIAPDAIATLAYYINIDTLITLIAYAD